MSTQSGRLKATNNERKTVSVKPFLHIDISNLDMFRKRRAMEIALEAMLQLKDGGRSIDDMDGTLAHSVAQFIISQMEGR
ncbi:MAG: hypothetical protein GY927_01860 [bacterium]|nr:hypothetical protein [bacterium]